MAIMRLSLRSLFTNKIFLYLSSRYFVYALQFVTLLFLAEKMGPYYYGIWGFVLMILSYFATVNLGIANSLNVFLVQNKDDLNEQKQYVASSITATLGLVFIVVIVAVVYAVKPLQIFDKYHIGNYFYVICFIAALDYFNKLFSNIYRVKNRLFELSFFQSIIPILVFISVFFFRDHELLICLLVVYIFAECISTLVFVTRGAIPFGGRPSKERVNNILNKGFFLFLYNSCFELILVTTSTVISHNYTVEEYGLFSFSYNLGHSILLILETFTFIVFPKLVDKFYSSDISEIKQLIKTIRVNYVSLSFFLILLAIIFFPVLILLFPKFNGALIALNLTGLAIVLSSNAFGYNTFLIARNKERTIAWISLISLIVNILLAITIAWLGLAYYCVVISIMISYIVFSCLCAFYAKKEMGEKCNNPILILQEVFPLSIMIPYICAIFISLIGCKWFVLPLPIVLFVIMNRSSVVCIIRTMVKIKERPSIIDL